MEKNKQRKLSRRDFLRLSALSAGAVAAASCVPAGPIDGEFHIGPAGGSARWTGPGSANTAIVERGSIQAGLSSETLTQPIVSLRFQPNQDETDRGITQPTDQPGQTRFVNEYLQGAMNATEAPPHDDLDYEYPGDTADSPDLYEDVDGLLEQARKANATIFHGGTGEGMMLPTTTAGVTWCNATDPNLLNVLAAEMQRLHDEGKFTFAVYTTDGIYRSGDDVSSGGGLPSLISNNAGLADRRSILFLAKPTAATLAEEPSVYQTQTVCDHPLGSATIPVR